MRSSAGVSNRRSGGILIIVLVIMISVAFMSAQGLQLMMLSRQSHDHRLKVAQLNELIELGRLRLAQQATEESFTVNVPQSPGQPERIGSVTIEKQENRNDAWRVIVRYPYNQPGELTVTWESPE